MAERLGLFGGTFDPPHVGHLVTAVNVRHELGLDRVLLVVNDQPWQKLGTREITPAEDRFAMVEAAVGSVEGIEASRIEIDRGGLSFTADTLHDLQAEAPDRELFVVLGSDAAGGLPSWERADEVRALATIVVVDRPGGPRDRAAAGLVVAAGRGAPARGLEHRPAGPRGRRAPARLPAHPRRDRGRARARPLPDPGGPVTTADCPTRRPSSVPSRRAPRPTSRRARAATRRRAAGRGPVRECGYRGRRRRPGRSGRRAPAPRAGGPTDPPSPHRPARRDGGAHDRRGGARRRRALRRAQQHGRSLPAGARPVRAGLPGERGAHPDDGRADAIRRRPSGRRRGAGARAGRRRRLGGARAGRHHRHRLDRGRAHPRHGLRRPGRRGRRAGPRQRS